MNIRNFLTFRGIYDLMIGYRMRLQILVLTLILEILTEDDSSRKTVLYHSAQDRDGGEVEEIEDVHVCKMCRKKHL